MVCIYFGLCLDFYEGGLVGEVIIKVGWVVRLMLYFVVDLMIVFFFVIMGWKYFLCWSSCDGGNKVEFDEVYKWVCVNGVNGCLLVSWLFFWEIIVSFNNFLFIC